MRLTKIKLAGFKSFVDPTTIPLSSNLTGIVGPNGCGKSNTIDAVRWVMGEVSAKHLRGDSMADVIFNGSTGRKPVGQASVELVFDNSDSKLGGQYANFSEIAIKRQVSRDGQSVYYLNGARCRRKDITGIFLGTGLGPRSYAIIEQGMISRLIEAKPEELRAFLEEAAGISKYKERRRETENRIRHTRENLDRLNDLREEVDKRLNTLQRQAKTAEKYKEYKELERKLKAELLALKWRTLKLHVQDDEKAIREQETAVEAMLAEQRSIEADLEKSRIEHTEATEVFNEVQGRFYGVGGDIARIEQKLQHNKELKQRQEADLAEVNKGLTELQYQVKQDQQQLQQVTEALAQNEPALEQARVAEQASAAALAAAEEAMASWQSSWETCNEELAGPARKIEVERSRIDQFERHMIQLNQRQTRIEEEITDLNNNKLEENIAVISEEIRTVEAQQLTLQETLEQVLEQVTERRQQNKEFSDQLHEAQGELQDGRGRLASLETLQQAALGKTEGAVSTWLATQQLDAAPRLAEQLEVQPGWEKAVETVLGSHLQAVCVDELDAVAEVLSSLEHGALVLFDGSARPQTAPEAGQSLLSQVQSEYDLSAMLAPILIADDLHQALRMRTQLQSHQSVITRDGLWLGPQWLRVARDADEKTGVLQREQEIKELKELIEVKSNQIAQLQQQLLEGREQLQADEAQREELQASLNRTHHELGESRAKLSAQQTHREKNQQRQEQLRRELQEVREEFHQDDEQTQLARSNLAQSLAALEQYSQLKEELGAQRTHLQEDLQNAKQQARADHDQAHGLALQVEGMRSTRSSTTHSIERLDTQLAQLRQRETQLQGDLNDSTAPLAELEQSLQTLLQTQLEVEAQLGQARARVEEIDQHLREREQGRAAAEQQVQGIRQELEQKRINWQGVQVRLQTIQEQIDQTPFTLEALFEGLPEGANESQWNDDVEAMERRIQRLGAINLAAIEEYEEESERSQYLAAQHADVTEALTTLEDAMGKIDRETRTRFKETFDHVNSRIQETFPRLFGGGHAYLEMIGEDLLDSGVAVMARPPGKRLSSIHLMSGGEKALTAVSMVFAIFELNPAPFCMLDEVDAPLDDANVGRFCELVKEMSERVQFIFITHNKVTMEIAEYLTGVTMHEPGVSRLVSVDVDEAAQLATG